MNYMTAGGTREADRASDGFLKGLASGIVVNNKDDKNLGRVEVQLDNHGDGQKTFWAPVLTPMAGPSRGLYALPEVDDKVLVGFVAEDPSKPVVLGGLWDASHTPPDNNSDEKNDRRLWRSRAEHELRFDDGDKNEIELTMKNGSRVYLAEKKAILEDGKGNKVEIDNGNITIQADTKITLKAAQVVIDASSTAELKAGATCKVQGAMVEIN
jgi:uncharacterized protein involved in type VI secretion and phage assembly